MEPQNAILAEPLIAEIAAKRLLVVRGVLIRDVALQRVPVFEPSGTLRTLHSALCLLPAARPMLGIGTGFGFDVAVVFHFGFRSRFRFEMRSRSGFNIDLVSGSRGRSVRRYGL